MLYPEYDQKKYIIDGANICGMDINNRKKFRIKNLLMVIETLTTFGAHKENIIVICDASLRHNIDDPSKYYRLKKQGIILESPAGIKADKFILNYCLSHRNCLIISNDLFREYYDQLPDAYWIKKHRIGVLKIKGEILLVPMRD